MNTSHKDHIEQCKLRKLKKQQNIRYHSQKTCSRT